MDNDENGDYKDKGYFHACTAFGKTYLMMAIAEGYRNQEKDKKIVIFEENATTATTQIPAVIIAQFLYDFLEIFKTNLQMLWMKE